MITFQDAMTGHGQVQVHIHIITYSTCSSARKGTSTSHVHSRPTCRSYYFSSTVNTNSVHTSGKNYVSF